MCSLSGLDEDKSSTLGLDFEISLRWIKDGFLLVSSLLFSKHLKALFVPLPFWEIFFGKIVTTIMIDLSV